MNAILNQAQIRTLMTFDKQGRQDLSGKGRTVMLSITALEKRGFLVQESPCVYTPTERGRDLLSRLRRPESQAAA